MPSTQPSRLPQQSKQSYLLRPIVRNSYPTKPSKIQAPAPPRVTTSLPPILLLSRASKDRPVSPRMPPSTTASLDGT
ncbi:hypothetical protein BP00DRAFT_421463 [Aspergillus indologenus CBS 114.80]|uniref:Uncharacterized protein n=1 Tax=Aspergillus indologenus CBS 114.80 TaxID=1450541 RepID=A0A2V5JC83_9EURO|nr:hypothetical protein BP00DRAFT_421463 [Aspergillus indologenus CBS 114.80]